MKPTLTLLIALLLAPLSAAHANETLSSFMHLVRNATWTEKWPNESGEIRSQKVTAEIWTAAMQAALDQTGKLHIPASDLPYWAYAPAQGNSSPKPNRGWYRRFVKQARRSLQETGVSGFPDRSQSQSKSHILHPTQVGETGQLNAELRIGPYPAQPESAAGTAATNRASQFREVKNMDPLGPRGEAPSPRWPASRPWTGCGVQTFWRILRRGLIGIMFVVTALWAGTAIFDVSAAVEFRQRSGGRVLEVGVDARGWHFGSGSGLISLVGLGLPSWDWNIRRVNGQFGYQLYDRFISSWSCCGVWFRTYGRNTGSIRLLSIKHPVVVTVMLFGFLLIKLISRIVMAPDRRRSPGLT